MSIPNIPKILKVFVSLFCKEYGVAPAKMEMGNNRWNGSVPVEGGKWSENVH